VAPGIVITADIDDPDVRSNELEIPYNPVQLLIREKFDYPAGFELDGITRIPADVRYGVADDLARDFIAFIFEYKKFISDGRFVKILKRSFSSHLIRLIPAAFSFARLGPGIISRWFFLSGFFLFSHKITFRIFIRAVIDSDREIVRALPRMEIRLGTGLSIAHHTDYKVRFWIASMSNCCSRQIKDINRL